MFDVADAESFKNWSFWLNKLALNVPKVVKILVANKIDL